MGCGGGPAVHNLLVVGDSTFLPAHAPGELLLLLPPQLSQLTGDLVFALLVT